jgi:hypothetical protein
MFPERLTRAALVRIVPEPRVLDAVVTDASFVGRLALEAKRFLLSGDRLSPELRSEVLAATSEQDLTVIATAFSFAADEGGWKWWETILPPVHP